MNIKKKQKKHFLAIYSLLGISAIAGIGLTAFIIAANNAKNNLYQKTSNQTEIIVEKNRCLTPFDCITLTTETVNTLGWDTKTEITLEDWRTAAPNVTKIEGAFNNNKVLTSIEIPAKIRIIDTFSFKSSSSLKSVIFEENSELTTIGEGAFQASGITSITIPDLTTSIDQFAFAEILTLDSLIFGANSQLEIMGESVFQDSGITSIAIPKSVTTIGNNAFLNTNSLFVIEMFDKFKKNILNSNYGFTQEQIDNIKWIEVPPLEKIENIIILASGISIIAVILIGNIFIIKELRNIKKIEKG